MTIVVNTPAISRPVPFRSTASSEVLSIPISGIVSIVPFIRQTNRLSSGRSPSGSLGHVVPGLQLGMSRPSLEPVLKQLLKLAPSRNIVSNKAHALAKAAAELKSPADRGAQLLVLPRMLFRI